MKRDYTLCDCCGERIREHNNAQYELKVSVRKFWFFGFDKRDDGLLDICERCQDEIFKEVKKRVQLSPTSNKTEI